MKEEWIVGPRGVSNLKDVVLNTEFNFFSDKVTGNHWDTLICQDTYCSYENACRDYIFQLEHERRDRERDLRVAQSCIDGLNNRIEAVQEDIKRAEAARVERMRQEIAESRKQP